MKYSRVHIDSIGYELPPVVVTSAELEARLRPVYQALRMPEGQLEALTGIAERRWWEPGYPLSQGAIAAARKALDASNVRPAGRPGADLRRRLPRAVRAGHRLPRRRGAGHQHRGGGLRPQQRLPGRAQRHRGHRQPHRAGPDPGRPGRLVRDGPRDQRHHHRGPAPLPVARGVQDLAGDADRRLRGGRRAGHRRLVRQGAAPPRAGRHATSPRRSTTACAGGA